MNAETPKPRCGAWGCHDADLLWLKWGESIQTKNGFVTAMIAGWFCPVCGASYGHFSPPKGTA